MKFKVTKYITEIFNTEGSESHWFGYYNTSPLKGKYLLAQRTRFDARLINENDSADIVLYDIEVKKVEQLDITKAFNWQQGSLLQWLDSQNIIYNTVDTDKYKSVILNVFTKHRTVLEDSIYSVLPGSKASVTLEFLRSYWVRAYHYEVLKNPLWNENIVESDGVFYFDFDKRKRRIISISDILKYEYNDDFKCKKHWFEHIFVSPDELRFLFYHRYGTNNAYKTRLFISNIDGTNLKLIKADLNYKWTHFNWMSSTQLVVFGQKDSLIEKTNFMVENKLGSIGKKLKRVYLLFKRYASIVLKSKISRNDNHTGDYIFFQIDNNNDVKIVRKLKGLDGHPSFTNDGRFMLTDTYQDKKSFRELIIYDLLFEKKISVGKFYSPYNNSSYRCDLHPRFSDDDKKIIIDSAHTGKRQVYVYEVNWDFIKGVS